MPALIIIVLVLCAWDAWQRASKATSGETSQRLGCGIPSVMLLVTLTAGIWPARQFLQEPCLFAAILFRLPCEWTKVKLSACV